MKYAYKTIRVGGFSETVLLAFRSAAERRAFNARHPIDCITRKRVARSHLKALLAVGTCGYNDAVYCAIVSTSFNRVAA